MFPQMANPGLAQPNWAPRFVDYLYISVTNVMAFSPTDTMPLARWAKVMMTLQASARGDDRCLGDRPRGQRVELADPIPRGEEHPN